MGSLMLANRTSHDFKFDSIKRRTCAFDGCRVDLQYTNPNKFQVLNDRRYCSLDCLKKQYRSLGIDGAVHLVHQVFGPEHPVTAQIQKMRFELKVLREHADLEDRKYMGKIKAMENHFKLCKASEKCL